MTLAQLRLPTIRREPTTLTETLQQRARRKFAGGALEQGGAILGAMSASVFVVGLIAPYAAALSGVSMVTPRALLGEAATALSLSLVAATASVTLKGLARREDDDARFDPIGSGQAPRQRRSDT
jgi:hypothetical protein